MISWTLLHKIFIIALFTFSCIIGIIWGKAIRKVQQIREEYRLGILREDERMIRIRVTARLLLVPLMQSMEDDDPRISSIADFLEKLQKLEAQMVADRGAPL